MTCAVRLEASIGRLVACTLACLVTGMTAPMVLASDYANPTQESGRVDVMVLGDFNGDGHQDAVIGQNLAEKNLRLVLGTGDGTFGPPVTLQTDVPIYRLAAADFDRDGRLDFVAFVSDLVFSTRLDPRVQLFRGRGDGTFDPPVATLVSSGQRSPLDMVVADLDGNGAPDVVVQVNDSFMSLCRLLNTGTGALSPAACQSRAANRLAVADFNEDGRPDVALENGGGVSVMFGTGSGPFSAGTSAVPYVPDGIGMIGVADVNLDDHADILYVPYKALGATTSAVGIATGNGAGGFAPPVTVPGASCCSGLGLADVDGDGVRDLVTAGTWEATVGGITVDPGLAGGGFGPARKLQTGGVRSMALGFLDGDALVDLAAGVGLGANYVSDGGLRSYLGTPDGRFGMTSLGPGSSTKAASADLNDDGHTDLVVVESVDKRISVFLSDGNGTFAAPLGHTYASSPSGLALGDFDGDGRIDAVTGLSTGLVLLPGNGDGTLAPAIPIPGGPHAHVVAGDFNGDDHLDLAAIQSSSYSHSALTVYLNAGNNGTFEPLYAFSTGYNPVALATGDVDGDGVLDLLLGSIPYSGGPVPFPYAPKTPGILRGQGDGTFGPPAYLTWNGSQSEIMSVLIADFTGDGISDLAVGTRASSGPGGGVLVYLGQGLGVFGSPIFPPQGIGPFAALAATDVDGDQQLDLVVGDRGASDIEILSPDGTGGFLLPVRFGTMTPASIATGDFNEDGKVDFALATPDAVATVVLSRAAEHDPIADAGPDRTGECGAAVLLDGSGSSDVDSTPGTNDDIVLFSWYENYGQASQVALGTGPTLAVPFTLGPHAVTLVVSDSTGRTGADDMVVTAVDSLPPTGGVALLPDVLWPPNHRMIDVTANLTAADQCGGPVTVTLDSVTSSEPDDAPGGADGTTTGDVAGVSPGTFDTQFALRAERASAGPGRVYTVSYRLADDSGRQAVVIGTVSVPHDDGGVTDPITLHVSLGTGGDALIEWNALEGASRYGLVAGQLSTLVSLDPAAGWLSPTCIGIRIPPETTSLQVAGDPEPGDAFFFLVGYISFADATNGYSGYGSDSGPYDLEPVVPANACP